MLFMLTTVYSPNPRSGTKQETEPNYPLLLNYHNVIFGTERNVPLQPLFLSISLKFLVVRPETLATQGTLRLLKGEKKQRSISANMFFSQTLPLDCNADCRTATLIAPFSLMLIPIRFQVEPNSGIAMAWPDHEKLMKSW